MNIRNSVDRIDADDLISNLKFDYNENIIFYLKEVWKVKFILN